MAKVKVTRPQARGPWDVDCDGVKFSVSITRVDPNGVPSGHDPTLTWEVNLHVPGDKRFAGYGTSGEGAFNATRRLATTTGLLSGVDWVEVTRALKEERAFR
jgi:hypothetical protein